MGRLTSINNITSTPVVLSATTSGTTNDGVYIFIDENGNVEQIKKDTNDRLMFYTDTKSKQQSLLEPCIIGVSDPVNGNCTEGIIMGTGDIGSSSESAYAIYE